VVDGSVVSKTNVSPMWRLIQWVENKRIRS